MLPLSGLEGGDASEEASSNAALTTVVNQQRNQAEQKLREEVMPFFRQVMCLEIQVCFLLPF